MLPSILDRSARPAIFGPAVARVDGDDGGQIAAGATDEHLARIEAGFAALMEIHSAEAIASITAAGNLCSGARSMVDRRRPGHFVGDLPARTS